MVMAKLCAPRSEHDDAAIRAVRIRRIVASASEDPLRHLPPRRIGPANSGARAQSSRFVPFRFVVVFFSSFFPPSVITRKTHMATKGYYRLHCSLFYAGTVSSCGKKHKVPTERPPSARHMSLLY